MRTELERAFEISALCNFILDRAPVIYLDYDTCTILSSMHGREVISGRTFIGEGHYSYSQIRIIEARCKDDYQIITVVRDDKTVFVCESLDAYTNPHKFRFLNTDLDWQGDITYFASLFDR